MESGHSDKVPGLLYWSKRGRRARTGVVRLVVFVDEAAEDRSSSDPVMPSRQPDHVGVVAGRPEVHIVALVAAAGVVVRDVPIENRPQMPFTEGEHPIG